MRSMGAVGRTAGLGILTVALLVGVAGGAGVVGAAATGPVVVFTVDLGGQLQPYEEVAGVQLGGLAHRVAYVAKLKAAGEQVVLADAGDAFFPEPTIAALTPEPSAMTAMYMGQVYTEQGAAAVNIGERDLALGLEFLQEMAETHQTPFVSANLTTLAGKPVFPAYRVVEAAGERVAFVGLLSATQSSTVSDLSGYQAVVQDPVRSLRRVMQEIAGKADRVVVLSQLTPSEESAVARAIKGIDAILGSAGDGSAPATETVNGVRIVRVGPRGGVVGRVPLGEAPAEVVELNTADIAPDADVAKKVEQFEVDLHQKCGC